LKKKTKNTDFKIENSLTRKIISYTEIYTKIWEQTEPDITIFDKIEKPSNKKKAEQEIEEVFKFFDYNKAGKDLPENFSEKIYSIIENCGFTFTRSFINDINKSTAEFIKMANIHLPDTTYSDIYQALRNVWIMNSLQYFLKIPVTCNNPVFAYSMMYPLTDNPMDEAGLKINLKKKKADFTKKLKEILITKKNVSRGKSKKKLFEKILLMNNLIEMEFPKDASSRVWASIYGIFNAQIESMEMQHSIFSTKFYFSPNYYKKVLNTSFEKGGTSVLADIYLVKPDIDENEAIFAFGFGLLLQIVDDIQDIEEDMKNNHLSVIRTIYNPEEPFRKCFKKQSPEMFNFLLKFLNFSYYCLFEYFPKHLNFSSNRHNSVFKWIFQSCSYIVFQNVVKYHEKYNSEFVSMVKDYLPLSEKLNISFSQNLKKIKTRTDKKLLTEKASSEITISVLSMLEKFILS